MKVAEYAHHFDEGVTLSTNTFYMFYLSLTFFHFMHVILGMVILAAVALKARARRLLGQPAPGWRPGPPTGTWSIWCG